MIPVQLAGIAVAGGALLAKYAVTRKNGANTDPTGTGQDMKPAVRLPEPIKLPDIQNQLHHVFDGLSSAVAQLTKSVKGEDYNSIVKGFLPEGAILLNPKHFTNSGELGLADLDGDSQDELLASYRAHSGVGTILLKKDGGQWFQAADLSTPGYDVLSFRDTANIAGTGKQQLLLGFPGSNRTLDMYAYSLENGSFKKLFERNCSRFEIVGGGKNRSSTPKIEQLAFWNKDVSGRYVAEICQWNGLQLEPLKDRSAYYQQRIIPFHVNLVKQNPYSPVGWYNLADTLADAGYKDDALSAAEKGRHLDKAGTHQGRYTQLKNQLQ